MAKLEGQTIAASYDQLLHVDTEGGGNSTTHVSVKDGDNDTTFGFTIASDALMMSSTNRLEFGDTGTYINQSGDGILNITSDTEVEINATAVDLNGTLDVSGTLTQGGASQFNSTITVGVNDTGYDVKLFGATSGAYALWDESADNLILAGGAGIYEAGGVLKENLLTNSGFDVWSNSTLENVGSDLVTNGAFTGNATGWTLESGWAYDSNNVTVTNGAINNLCARSITTVVGKLYKVSVGCTAYTDGSVGALSNATSVRGNELTGTGTSTLVFEATSTSTTVGAITLTAGSDYTVDNITCYEVTPGCVAADELAFDGWVKNISVDIFQQHNDGGTLTHDGSFYALKTVTAAVEQYTYWSDRYDKADFTQRFTGRTITIGCWAKTSTASHVRLRIYDDGDGARYSSYHTGGGAWEWLEYTATINAAATVVSPCTIYYDVSGATAYISQPMLVFGSSIGEGNYTRPMNEVVFFEANQLSNEFNNSTVGDTVEVKSTADSDGVVPKGAKAVYATLEGKAAANPGYLLYSTGTGIPQQHLQIANIVNGVSGTSQGWLAIESNGDFSIAEVTPYTGVYLYYTGVMLR